MQVHKDNVDSYNQKKQEKETRRVERAERGSMSVSEEEDKIEAIP